MPDQLIDGQMFRQVGNKLLPISKTVGDQEFKLIGKRYFPINKGIEDVFNKAPGVQSYVPKEEQINTPGQIIPNLLRSSRETISGLASGVGAALTSGASIPVSMAAGFGAGAATDLAIRGVTGEYGKDSPPSIGEYLLNRKDPTGIYPSIENAALNEGFGRLLNFAGQKMPIRSAVARILENITTKDPNFDPAAIAKFPKVPGSASFKTGSKGQNFVEGLLSPGRKAEVQTLTKKALDKEGIQIANELLPQLQGQKSDIVQLYGMFKGNLKRFVKTSENLSSSYAQDVINVSKLNRITVGTTREPITIEGPISLRGSLKFLDEFIRKYNPNYAREPLANVNIANEADREIYNLATQVMQGLVKNEKGQVVSSIASFEKVWALKKGVGQRAFASKEGVIAGAERNFRKLYRDIDGDIKISMPKWDGGTTALDHYNLANTIVTRRNELIGTGSVLSKLEAFDEVDVTKFPTIFKDPTKLGRAIQTGNKKEIQAWKFQDMLDNAYDSQAQMYNGKQLINAFEDPKTQSMFKMLYNKDQRTTIGQFFNLVARNSAKISKAGQIALAIRGSNRLVELGAGLATGAVFMAPTTSVIGSAGIVGIIFTMHKFARNVLLNPKFADFAIKAIAAPPTSPAAKIATRGILGAMQGTKVLLRRSDGTMSEGIIDNSKIIESIPGVEPVKK